MFYADTIGLDVILKAFESFASQFGDEYDYWKPAPLLVKLAQAGKTFADYDADRSVGD